MDLGKVLLIHPAPLFSQNSRDFTSIPSAILLLGTYLKSKKVNVEFISLYKTLELPKNIKGIAKYYHSLVKYLQKNSSNVKYVGISAYSSFSFLSTVITSWAIREAIPDATIITGGYAVNTRPEDFIYENSPFDYIVFDEADIEFYNLIKSIELGFKKKQPGKQKYAEKIYPKGIQDLDSLPPIDFSLLNGTSLMNEPFLWVFLYGSRGCPYTCKFCSDLSNMQNKNTYKKHWRSLKVPNLMRDVQNAHDYFGKKDIIISFADPIFGLNPKWMNEFTTELIKKAKKWDHRAFGLQYRIEQVNNKQIKKLSQLDSALALGLETGAGNGLLKMNKTKNPIGFLKKMKSNKEIFEKHQMYWAPYLMYGYPGETKIDAQETQKYLSNLYSDTKYGVFSIWKYEFYPGSSFYKENYHFDNKRRPRSHYPDWHKYAYNGDLLSMMFDPSNEFSNTESMQFYRNWGKNLVEDTFRNFEKVDGKNISYMLGLMQMKSQLNYWENILKYSEVVMNSPYPIKKIPLDSSINQLFESDLLLLEN
jgi:radical SAM superfamily enzyme YgiQ (UPF0313 family)